MLFLKTVKKIVLENEFDRIAQLAKIKSLKNNILKKEVISNAMGVMLTK